MPPAAARSQTRGPDAFDELEREDLLELAVTLDEIERRMARRNPFIFFRRYLPHWFDCKEGPHHRDMIETTLEMLRLQRPRRYPSAEMTAAWAVPRGHGKTTGMMGFALFLLLNWEEIELFQQYDPAFVYVFSNTLKQATRDLRMVKLQLETNALLRADYGVQVGAVWRNDEIHLRNGAKMAAAGAGTSVRGALEDGGRPNVLFFDDCDDEDNCLTEEQRQKLESWFDRSAVPLSIAGESITIAWGTILHVDSLLAKLTDRELRPAWGGRIYQALVQGQTPRDEDAEALWPAKQSVKRLKKAYARGTARSWATEYMNQPSNDETSLFPMTWLTPALDRGRALPMLREPPTERMFVVHGQGVDLAFVDDPKKAEVQKSAFNVCISGGIDRAGNLHVYFGSRKRGLTPTGIDDWLIDCALTVEPDFQAVEKNHAGHVHIDTIRRTTSIPVKKHDTGKNKHSNREGVPGLQRPFEDGKVILYCGDAESMAFMQTLVHELHHYPGRYTDCVMAFWILWFRLRIELRRLERARQKERKARRALEAAAARN